LRERLLDRAAEQAGGVGSARSYNFLACERDQAFLLPLDLRDWLPADYLAWFVLDVVDHLDLGPFLKAYRADGHGRAADEPRMLLAVLLYAYCTGVRSFRQIERHLKEDLAFRVLAGNQFPDHVTIARFRASWTRSAPPDTIEPTADHQPKQLVNSPAESLRGGSPPRSMRQRVAGDRPAHRPARGASPHRHPP
jgi:transposase